MDLRRAGWRGKSGAIKGPTTIENVRAQADRDEREKEQARQIEQAQRRGGGGGSNRAHLGQGDARNFAGNMPPPDYRTNSVNPSDIRRLQQRNQSRQTGVSAQSTFGPPSMFASARGSNTRRPGLSSLTRTEGDSSASSRTGTPPVGSLGQKDKKEKEEKEATTKNAFRYEYTLALLNCKNPS